MGGLPWAPLGLVVLGSLQPASAWGGAGLRLAINGRQLGSDVQHAHFSSSDNMAWLRQCSGERSSRRRADLVRLAGVRKRSKVNSGPEERQYLEKILGSEGTEADIEDETEDGIAESAWGINSYLNRDRRFMRMGDEERAYYDRLNAYKGDQEPLNAAAAAGQEAAPTVYEKMGTQITSRFSYDATFSMHAAGTVDMQESMEVTVVSGHEALNDVNKAPPQATSELPNAYSVAWYTLEMTRKNDEGKPNVALTLWQKLKRGEGCPPGDRLCKPTAASYTQALRACFLIGDVQLGMHLISELKDGSSGAAGTDIYASGLDWFVRLLGRSRRLDQALALFEELSQERRMSLRTSSFNVLMEELAAIRRWREVSKMLTLLRAYKAVPDAASYSWAITALVAQGDMQQATALLTDMTDAGHAPSSAFWTRWAELTGCSADAAPGAA